MRQSFSSKKWVGSAERRRTFLVSLRSFSLSIFYHLIPDFLPDCAPPLTMYSPVSVNSTKQIWSELHVVEVVDYLLPVGFNLMTK